MSKIQSCVDPKILEILEGEPEMKVAHLLINHVLGLNDFWWKDHWPEDARQAWAMFVNCNDSFAWATADAEEIVHDEIDELYDMWKRDPHYGPIVWVAKKRNLMPIDPIAKSIMKEGIWDLKKYNLTNNTITDSLKLNGG